MKPSKSKDEYSEKETQARVEAALKGAMSATNAKGKEDSEENEEGARQAETPTPFTSKDKQEPQEPVGKRLSQLLQNTG